MNEDKQALLDALNAERYGRSGWWTTPTEQPDDELTCARRRRLLDKGFHETTREVS